MQVPKKKKGDAVKQPVAALQPEKKSNSKKWWILLPLLLLLGLAGWYFTKSGLFSTGSVPASTFTSSPPFDVTQVGPIQSTQTFPQPSATSTEQLATSTATQTVTAVPLPMVTSTQLVPSSSPEPVLDVPTANGNGNNLTLFWNETSFVMLNRSSAIRSVSGFTFEQLGANDKPTASFPGYRWENRKFKYIPPDNCVAIYAYNNEIPPYLNPFECNSGYSGIIQLEKEKEPELFFWLPEEGSTQFRVLWLNEEVARCEIDAGTCEIYIP